MNMVETVYRIPDAPRIALLSDLHGRPTDRIIESLKSHKPDFICIAGDILYGTSPRDDVSPLISQSNVMPFLEACTRLAPTYFSLGNHEWMIDEGDEETIKRSGVIVLDNSWVDTGRSTGSGNIFIGGVTSESVASYRRLRSSLKDAGKVTERYPKLSVMNEMAVLKTRSVKHDRSLPDMDWLEGFSRTSGYHVLLSHHPEYFDHIDPNIELVLSGHSHGGQWNYWSPVTRRWEGVFAPGQGVFPKYSSGVYENKGSRMVVSRGLSNTAPIPRIFNPTEIVYIEPM